MTLALFGLLVDTILKLLFLLLVFDRFLLLLEICSFALVCHRFELVVQLFLLTAEKFPFLTLLFFLKLLFLFCICLSISSVLTFLFFLARCDLCDALFTNLLKSLFALLSSYLCLCVLFFLQNCFSLIFLCLFSL